jgi:hypothetical protein
MHQRKRGEKKLPMKKEDEPNFYDNTNYKDLPELNDAPIPGDCKNEPKKKKAKPNPKQNQISTLTDVSRKEEEIVENVNSILPPSGIVADEIVVELFEDAIPPTNGIYADEIVVEPLEDEIRLEPKPKIYEV